MESNAPPRGARRTVIGRALALWLLFAVASCWCSTAHAEAVTDGATPPAASSLYWERGETRPFVSAAIAPGLVSTIEAAAGYGKPHWMWGGVEAIALTTPDFGMLSLGARVTLLVADLSFRRRWVHAYSHAFLPQRTSHSSLDIEEGSGPSVDYAAWDASLGGLVPTYGGFGLYEIATTRVEGVPEGVDFFEEWNRVVMRNKTLYTIRLGWCALVFDERLAVGLIGELLAPKGRDNTWRAGPMLDYRITDHLSATLVYSVPMVSTDSLGMLTGAWTILRLRYAVATSEPHAAFP